MNYNGNVMYCFCFVLLISSVLWVHSDSAVSSRATLLSQTRCQGQTTAEFCKEILLLHLPLVFYRYGALVFAARGIYHAFLFT